MDNFNITVDGKILTIKPQHENTFQVFEGENFLAELNSMQDEYGGYSWFNPGEFPNDEFDSLVGKAIEVYLPQV
jgi:hypothetical protein